MLDLTKAREIVNKAISELTKESFDKWYYNDLVRDYYEFIVDNKPLEFSSTINLIQINPTKFKETAIMAVFLFKFVL